MHSSAQQPADPRLASTLAALNPSHVAVVDSRDFRAFHNALRILRSIDEDNLFEAGIVDDVPSLQLLLRSPFDFFIKTDDQRAAAMWALIQARQPADLRAETPAAPTALAAE